MITTNTVLVLGAGASKPYGLPLGRDLTDAICSWAKTNVPDDISALWQGCGYTPIEVRTFARTFLESRVKSVDAFIEKRSQFADCGKVVMAWELCRCENPKAILHQDLGDDWYRHLWDNMHTGAASADDVARNKLRVITFNYDRSLEYFLLTAIKGTYGLNDDAALAIVRRIPILHLYGQLGELAVGMGAGARPYTATLAPPALRIAADGIKIIPEARDGDHTFQEARKWFEWATHIGFLGFGFDETNCQRLRLDSVLTVCRRQNLPEKRIFASVSGMTDVEVRRAKDIVCPSDHWLTLADRCLPLLRHTELL